MSINEDMENIKKRYHPKGGISGGIMPDYSLYQTSNGKMLALLKDVNAPNTEYNWGLPDLMKDIYYGAQEFTRTWKNLSRWAICAEAPDITFDKLDNIQLKEGLKLFAVTNIKKIAGIGSILPSDIIEEARINKDEWLEEIQLLQPNFILCCGTYYAVKSALNINQTNIYVSETGAEGFLYNDTFYLDFVHPAFHGSDKMAFSYIKETILNLRKHRFF